MGLYFLISFILVLIQDCCSHPGVNQEGVPPILKPFEGSVDGVESIVRNVAKSKTLSTGFPDSGRTHAILELQSKESLPLQLDNKYGNLQQFVAGIFKPQPVVDNTQEYEKYGNDGSKSRNVANLIVGGYEGLSNVLNAAAEAPFVATYQFGKKITASLNTVGGKLVGLS